MQRPINLEHYVFTHPANAIIQLVCIFLNVLFYEYISRAAVLYQLYNGLVFFFGGVFLYLLHKLSVVVCVLPLGATPLLDLIVGLTLAKMCHWDQSALKTKLCLNNG